MDVIGLSSCHVNSLSLIISNKLGITWCLTWVLPDRPNSDDHLGIQLLVFPKPVLSPPVASRLLIFTDTTMLRLLVFQGYHRDRMRKMAVKQEKKNATKLIILTEI